MYEDYDTLCEMLSDELHEAVGEIKGEMSRGDLERIDKLTHAMKTVVLLKAMEDDRGYHRKKKDVDIKSELEAVVINSQDPQTKEEVKALLRKMGY